MIYVSSNSAHLHTVRKRPRTLSIAHLTSADTIFCLSLEAARFAGAPTHDKHNLNTEVNDVHITKLCNIMCKGPQVSEPFGM